MNVHLSTPNGVNALFRVLIVDDEENIVNSLSHDIEWQMLGVEKVFTAGDGLQALDTLSKNSIDIMITDIRMPNMNGLSLIKNARNLYPALRIILLSSYGEFEYAREALRLGVENYILKPISKIEIEQTITATLNSLYENKHSHTSLLMDNVLRRWLGGNITDDELGERATVLGLNLYLPQYCVLCLVSKDPTQTKEFFSSASAFLAQSYDVYPYNDEKGRFVMILGGKNVLLDEICSELTHLATSMGVEQFARLACGVIVNETKELQKSYTSACDIIELADAETEQFVLHNEYRSDDVFNDFLAADIRLFFWNSDKSKAKSVNNNILRGVFAEGKTERNEKMLSQFKSTCIKTLLSEFPLQEELHTKAIMDYSGIDFSSKKQCEVAAIGYLDKCKELFSEISGQYSPIVQLGKRYVIDTALSGDTGTIKEFCNSKKIHPAYFGNLFKNETGFFFNDYLMHCRLSYAIALLRNPNNKTKDIANKVGFMSPSYFIKCFREKKGVSPSKYRIMMGDK